MAALRVGLPFEKLLDAAPDGMIVCDRSGTIVYANRQVEEMFGYAAAELISRNIDVLIPDVHRTRHREHVDRYASAPHVRPMGAGYALVGRRKDGSQIEHEISLAPVQTDDSNVYITAGIRDVSARRRLEREQRRTSSYLASAVDAIREAFVLFDETDRVVLVNSTARDLFGAVHGDIVGRTFEELVDTAINAGVIDAKDELQVRWSAYHTAPRGTFDLRTTSGHYLRVTSCKTPERGTVTTIADVSDDVHREAELRIASAAKTEFLSSMSHELRTPLNAVLGFAQLLERDKRQPLTDRQRERVHRVTSGGEHLLRLIDDVLALSKIEAGALSMSLEAVNVAEVLDEVIAAIEPLAIRGEIELVAPTLTADLPRVIADRTRLAQILMNLGSNAIKYGKKHGHVRFEIELAGARVRLIVRDDGIGIPEDKRARIFEPFQRAGQEMGPIEGTGIGLTISQRLAGLMDSRIEVSSEVGVGSKFWLDLPQHRKQTLDVDTSTAVPTREFRLDADGRHYTVVYIEDNPSNIEFMREVMVDLGIELLTAPTAEIGLELVRARRPAVVILDINLPGISGFEALERLRAWHETSNIPVIALSASALAKDVARGEEAGFFRYLTKPVKLDALTAALTAAVS